MYVPQLPTQLLDIVDLSFMPFIVGVSRKHLNRISREGKVFVDLDIDRVYG